MVYDTAFGGEAPLGRGARVAFVQIRCSADTHRCFDARYTVNARALFACFRVERRSADPALLRALGQAIDDAGEIGDRALIARLAPAAPLPTYAVVRITFSNEVPIYAKQAPCRGPCAHYPPRQVGTRRERLTSEMEVLPGGGSPGSSEPTRHLPLAIARRVPLLFHYFLPEKPSLARDRLAWLVGCPRCFPADVTTIVPWVEAETDSALRFSGYVMLASAALSGRTTGAPAKRWLAEVKRLAPIVKARLDANGRAAVDETLQSLATLRAGGFLTNATACPPRSGAKANVAPRRP